MNYFATSIVIIYLLALVWVGLRGHAVAKDGEMYNVFGRKAGVVRATAGYLSLIGGGELLALSQFGYDNGLGVLWFLGGIVAGFLLLAAMGDRIRARAEAIGANTFAGFVRVQYGAGAASGLGLVYVVALGSLLTIQFIVGGDLIAALTGLPPTLTSIIMAAVIVSYLIAAGFVAVLSTDLLRAALLVGVLALAVASLQLDGFNLAVVLGPQYTSLPVFDGVAFFALGLFGVICAADVWQTAIASRNRSVLRRSMVTAAVAFLGVGLLIALLGAQTKQVVPQLADGISALVATSTQALTPELAPLVALMVIGAVVATADTEIWVIATTLLGLRKGAPSSSEDADAYQARTKNLTRWLIPIVTICALGLAFFTRDARGLYEGLLILLTAIAPAMLGILLFPVGGRVLAATIWAGILAFAGLAAFHRLAIPLGEAFVPAGVATAVFALTWTIERISRPRSPL